jgi:DnaK suppressor protein
MDGHRMRRFKTLLEVRQHELRLRIKGNQQYARGAEPEPDIVDQAASESDKGSFFERSDREHQLLRAIDSALDRIRAGSYGACLSCRKEIDERRLAAIPWTPYCIQCEEASEAVTR